MKNLKVRKKMLALAIFNTILLTKLDIYAANVDIIQETKDIMDCVKAKEDASIMQAPTSTSTVIGTLDKGKSLRLLGHIDGYYEVLYNGKEAYIRDNIVEEAENNSTYGYLTEDTTLYAKPSFEDAVATIDKYQLVNIIKVNADDYLVVVNGRAGYVNKNNVERLYDKYIVVDISDQKVTMYDNNNIILDSDVVTGTPPYDATPLGIYEMYYIGDHYKLKGRYYVDHMMAFNGNIGCHDAEYHTNEQGYSYGWRDSSEFGGDTYLTNGSHGCVNMTNAASELMRQNVEIGQKVLVKE